MFMTEAEIENFNRGIARVIEPIIAQCEQRRPVMEKASNLLLREFYDLFGKPYGDSEAGFITWCNNLGTGVMPQNEYDNEPLPASDKVAKQRWLKHKR